MKPVLILGLLLATTGAMAQPQGGPPPEALAACKSAKAGADCSFTAGGKAAKGTCWAPEGRPLACRPAGGKPPPPDAERTPAR